MKIYVILAIMALFSLIAIHAAEADVGVGISPAKIRLQIEGGKVQDASVLVFNSGDKPLEISLAVEGDIAEFTEVQTEGILIDPEPKPHQLPIKNGKTFSVQFHPPATTEPVTYTGMISATGGSAGGSSFGGNVGVATQVEIITTPTASIFAFITTTHLIILAAIILLVLVIFALRRAGLSISFKKQ